MTTTATRTTRPAHIACTNCTDMLRPAGSDLFANTPVHVTTGNTACSNGRTATPNMWGIKTTAGTAWALDTTPTGYGCS
ncbi:hypothetical protein ACFO5K_04230 [Nocardia halotolerans]|uniref:Uncharacterized protein n=1 Tax=Nocardia halotolerans TaxID=1755878 RepID=A0ABV8VDK2_9NOCA